MNPEYTSDTDFRFLPKGVFYKVDTAGRRITPLEESLWGCIWRWAFTSPASLSRSVKYGLSLFWNTYNRGNTSIENIENIAVNKSQQTAASSSSWKIIMSTSTGGVLHMYFQSAAVWGNYNSRRIFLDFSSTSVLSSPMKEVLKEMLRLPTNNELFTLLLVRDGHHVYIYNVTPTKSFRAWTWYINIVHSGFFPYNSPSSEL
jgi:hypothetical protein